MLALALLAQTLLAAPGWCVEVGERIPDLGSVQSLSGETITAAALAGKPVLIVFWNTWCPNCSRELPRVARLAGRYSANRLAVLAINTGLNDSEGKARSYWKKYGYRFPALFDRYFELGKSFRVSGVPTVLLIDRKGIVRYKNAALPEDVEKRIADLSR
jgi:thiol-disulfide isomerase/thioredoxin